MKKSRFSETQIIAILKQADAGMAVKDVCRKAGISVPTYYQWKSKYGGLEASDLKRVSAHERVLRPYPLAKYAAAFLGCRAPQSRA